MLGGGDGERMGVPTCGGYRPAEDTRFAHYPLGLALQREGRLNGIAVTHGDTAATGTDDPDADTEAPEGDVEHGAEAGEGHRSASVGLRVAM